MVRDLVWLGTPASTLFARYRLAMRLQLPKQRRWSVPGCEIEIIEALGETQPRLDFVTASYRNLVARV
jgi:hypothetical protein